MALRSFAREANIRGDLQQNQPLRRFSLIHRQIDMGRSSFTAKCDDSLQTLQQLTESRYTYKVAIKKNHTESLCRS